MKKLISALSLAALILTPGGGLALGQSGKVKKRQNVVAPGGQERPPDVRPRLRPGDRRMNRPPLLDSANPQNLNNQQRRKLMQQRLFEALEVTPDQMQRMREVRRGFEDEAITTNRRVREARRALDRAIMSEPYDEEMIRRQAEELALAQADQVRLQARIRARIRGVLTPAQVLKFQEMQRRIRRQMREQQLQRDPNQQGAHLLAPPGPPEAWPADLLALLWEE